MCLAVPAKIISLQNENSNMGLLEKEGLRFEADLSLIPDAAPGDYVIVHVGVALSKMDVKEAEEVLKTLQEFHASHHENEGAL
jgi:hydrogenase expression/formation protein HypC